MVSKPKAKKIIITKTGTPYLDLMPNKPTQQSPAPGLLKGQIQTGADFDETPPELIQDFEDN